MGSVILYVYRFVLMCHAKANDVTSVLGILLSRFLTTPMVLCKTSLRLLHAPSSV